MNRGGSNQPEAWIPVTPEFQGQLLAFHVTLRQELRGSLVLLAQIRETVPFWAGRGFACALTPAEARRRR